ncbi:MAG: nuclease [Chloroflexi bacterium]|nr:MAG: nuclease [Chloroflexota bacterium]
MSYPNINRRLGGVGSLLVLGAILLHGWPAVAAPLHRGAPPTGSTRAFVTKVVDGDTIHVRIGTTNETVRLIGIDTPEVVDPRKPVQCYGREASARTKALLDQQTVYLQADSTQGDRDRYGRLLRYVWSANGVDTNLLLISDGYAFEYTYAVPYRAQLAYKAAQSNARSAQRGLWSPSTCAGVVAATKTRTATKSPTPTRSATATPAGAVSAASAPCSVGQIKGNRTSMIYHLPSGAYYAKTKLNVQCFDAERAAVQAGYRRSAR